MAYPCFGEGILGIDYSAIMPTHRESPKKKNGKWGNLLGDP
jgi:hypothetical protein